MSTNVYSRHGPIRTVRVENPKPFMAQHQAGRFKHGQSCVTGKPCVQWWIVLWSYQVYQTRFGKSRMTQVVFRGLGKAGQGP